MIKGSIQEDITIVNIYTPNYISRILTDIKGEIDSNTIIVGDFNTPLKQWADDPDRKSTKKHRP